MRLIPIAVIIIIISYGLAGAVQGNTYDSALETHFTNVQAIQDVRVRVKQSRLLKGLPLRSREEYESLVAHKAKELKKENPSYSDEDATMFARYCLESDYGEHLTSYKTSGVRSGSTYRVVREPLESSKIIPFSTERHPVEEGIYAIKKGEILSLAYHGNPPSVMERGVYNQGILSGESESWGNLFDYFTLSEYNGGYSSFNDFKAAYDKKGFALLREDSASVVIGAPGVEISLDKLHDMLIQELIEYSTSPDNTIYVSERTVNSDFKKTSGLWLPYKFITENFKWDEISRAEVLTAQLITEFEDIEVNCGVSQEELDFLVPAHTVLTADSKDVRVATSALPYRVETPTLFSKLERDLRPTKDVEDRILSEALLALDTADQRGDRQVADNKATSDLASKKPQSTAEIRQPDAPNAALPSRNVAHDSRTGLLVSVLFLIVVGSISAGIFLYERKSKKL